MGGFGLSEKAMLRIAELKGLKVYPMADSHFGNNFFFLEEPNGRTTEQMFKDRVEFFTEDSLERHDPILVQVVEELGDESNGMYAKLRIANVGSIYRIHEYDGYESVQEPNGIDWTTI